MHAPFPSNRSPRLLQIHHAVAWWGTGFAALLSMTASGADLFVGPTHLGFGDEFTGATSPQLVVAITNLSGVTQTLALAGGAVSDHQNFGSEGQTCPNTLAPGASCEFRYVFHPVSSGMKTSGTIIGVNGVNYPVYLSGTGIDAFTVAPLQHDFGDVLVGETTSIWTVAVTNISDTAQIPALAGGALFESQNFGSEGQTCGVVAPHASCGFRYVFHPVSPGIKTSGTTIGVNGVNYSITLVGNGDGDGIFANGFDR
jgi:hypothetical protein